MHRQERQAPQLPNVALGRRDSAQRNSLILTAIVRPRPNLMAQLRTAGVNSVPEAVVRREDLVVQLRVGAEIWVRLVYECYATSHSRLTRFIV